MNNFWNKKKSRNSIKKFTFLKKRFFEPKMSKTFKIFISALKFMYFSLLYRKEQLSTNKNKKKTQGGFLLKNFKLIFKLINSILFFKINNFMYFYAKKTLYLNITRQDESNDTKIYCIKLKKKKFFLAKGSPLWNNFFKYFFWCKGGPLRKNFFFFFKFLQ